LPVRELDANGVFFADELLLDGLTPAGDLGLAPLTLDLNCGTTTLDLPGELCASARTAV
jgi:hypothetical protein